MKQGKWILLGMMTLAIFSSKAAWAQDANTVDEQITEICDKFRVQFPLNPEGQKCEALRTRCEEVIKEAVENEIPNLPVCRDQPQIIVDEECLKNLDPKTGDKKDCVKEIPATQSCRDQQISEIIIKIALEFQDSISRECPPLENPPVKNPPVKNPPEQVPPVKNPPQAEPPADQGNENPAKGGQDVDNNGGKDVTGLGLQLQGSGCSLGGLGMDAMDLSCLVLVLPLLGLRPKKK